MTRGRNFLLLSGAMAAASCSATHQVEVRAIPIPGMTSKTGDDLLLQARGHLALGDVGLALENFRTLQREQPENPDVFEGIARCYAVMGRFDLVRTNLEFALAYAPNDANLLNEMASALDRLNERDQAAQVRTEVARLVNNTSSPSASQQAAITPMSVPRAGSLTVKLPMASIASEVRKVQPAAAATMQGTKLAANDVPVPHFVSTDVHINIAAVPNSLARQPAIAVVEIPAVRIVSTEQASPPAKSLSTLANPEVAFPHIDKSESHVEVVSASTLLARQKSITDAKLPQLKLSEPDKPAVVAKSMQRNAVMPEHSVRSQPIELASSQLALADGPHLERTSRGEVALITRVQQFGIAQLDQRTARLKTIEHQTPTKRQQPQSNPQQMAELATRVQWVPLKYATIPQNVEILNAARSQGLAARARLALQGRGWRKIAIGNAHAVRQRSLVLYSAARVQVARRLAAQFRCSAKQVAGIKTVIVLLGRDASQRLSEQTRA